MTGRRSEGEISVNQGGINVKMSRGENVLTKMKRLNRGYCRARAPELRAKYKTRYVVQVVARAKTRAKRSFCLRFRGLRLRGLRDYFREHLPDARSGIWTLETTGHTSCHNKT